MWRATLLSGLLLALVGGVGAQDKAKPKWDIQIDRGGRVLISQGQTRVGMLMPCMFEAEWRYAQYRGTAEAAAPGKPYKGVIRSPSGINIDCSLTAEFRDGGLILQYALTPQKDIKINGLHVTFDIPIRVVAGQGFVVDGRQGKFPEKLGAVHLWNRPAQSVTLGTTAGLLQMSLAKGTHVVIQDNRKWGPNASIRLGPSFNVSRIWKAGITAHIGVALTTEGGINAVGKGIARDDHQQVEIPDDPIAPDPDPDPDPDPTPEQSAGDAEWIALPLELDIEAGSALDFSGFGHLHQPAGKLGRLTATPEGEFVFANDPERQPRRFYGVNLGGKALFLTPAQADKLADRLQRLGYNAVRFHDYEKHLLAIGSNSITLNATRLAQFDYLFAALRQRGIYVALDLYSSRPVFAREIWTTAKAGDVLSPAEYKMLLPAIAAARENWQAFAKALLGHQNPHTRQRYADDPALAWLGLVDEGNPGNFIHRLTPPVKAAWQREWNAWLLQRYKTAAAVRTAWRDDLDGDPAKGTVALPFNVRGRSPAALDLVAFLGAREAAMVKQFKTFLRHEIKTQALVTNSSGWINRLGTHTARVDLDFTDDHFHVDHPQFLDKPDQLPARCRNINPILSGAPGGRESAFVRLMDRPFTVSAYNYCYPDRHRGISGLLAGSLAAIQSWNGVWRFTYGTDPEALFQAAPANFQSLVRDPLNQAADRAAMCLFLRGDMDPAPHVTTILLNPETLRRQPSRNPKLAPDWHAIAFVSRVGTEFRDLPVDAVLTVNNEPTGIDPYERNAGRKLLNHLKGLEGFGGNRTNLQRDIIQSGTQQLLIDGRRGLLVVNTPHTAGGFAPRGRVIRTDTAIIKINKTNAAVWITSVDGRPLGVSKRMLITHLTDLQNTDAGFAEPARQTLTAWGKLPHRVLNGQATITIHSEHAADLKVWSLSTSGKRQRPVLAQTLEKNMTIPLKINGPNGARILYEVSTQ